MKNYFVKSIVTFILLIPLTAFAELPWQHDQHTRFLVLGDSISAGYGADPTMNGYAYKLYKQGVFDTQVHTLFANAAVPGVTSTDVRAYQIPQVERFSPDVIVMTVGGNDLIAVLEGRSELSTTVVRYQENLTQTLMDLCVSDKKPFVYLANIYGIPQLGEQVNALILYFNQIMVDVVTGAAASGCPVKLVDIHSAFAGRSGLLNIARHDAQPDEVHPTNAGHGVIADAFKQVIQQ